MDDILTKYVCPREGEGFSYRVKIETMRRCVDFLEVNDWIERNIKGTWSDVHNNRGYFVEFELEEDAVAFKLRWI